MLMSVIVFLPLCRFDQAMVAFIDCLQQVRVNIICFVLLSIFNFLDKSVRYLMVHLSSCTQTDGCMPAVVDRELKLCM